MPARNVHLSSQLNFIWFQLPATSSLFSPVLQCPAFCSVIAHVTQSTLMSQDTKNIDPEIFSLVEYFPTFPIPLTWFNSNFGSRTVRLCFQSVYRSAVPAPCHHRHPHRQNSRPFPIALRKYTSLLGNSDSQRSSLLLPTFSAPEYLKQDTRSAYRINRERSEAKLLVLQEDRRAHQIPHFRRAHTFARVGF